GAGLFGSNFSDPALLYAGIDNVVEQVMRKSEGVFAQAGRKTCIIAPELSGILAHEAVGHTAEADFVISGSVAGPCRGKEVASPIVTLTDFANTYNGTLLPTPIFVDDEGVKAQDAVLIDHGILTGWMHNRASADRYSDPRTGNALAFAFADEPLIRMRNTAILPGNDKLEDMIASVDDGYYFTATGNGQADATGEFMFGVTMGYEIKNGKLGRALRDTTVSGVAFDVLKTVDMISDDMVWLSSGMCGKKQPFPVGMGGPHLKCEINVGGN
ncbi:MAG: TldD/PmbA family protein, partial [Clostridia bacterium]|nr:TldD/PmbA family protein [Clostridia bacterium]